MRLILKVAIMMMVTVVDLVFSQIIVRNAFDLVIILAMDL